MRSGGASRICPSPATRFWERSHEDVLQFEPPVFAGGGSDVLQLVKERIVQPDVIVNLKTMANLNQITKSAGGVAIGGQTTLDTISRHDSLRTDYTVLAEAAGSAATPQVRNVGTIAGNVCQRPWCWYFRNGFQCYKNGG